MRVHKILMTVLIAGMLNFNVVFGRNQVIRSMLVASNNFGIIDESSLGYYLSEFKVIVRSICVFTGQSWPEDVATAGQIKAEECIASLTNSTRYFNNWDWLLNDTARVDTYVNTYCPKITSLRAYVREFTRSGEHCLVQADRDINNIIDNLIFSTLGFLCENNGKRLKDLVAAGTVECAISKNKDLMACREPPKFDENVLTENLFANLTIKQYGELKKFQRCNVNVLKTCQNQTTANFANDLANLWFH